MSKLSEILQNHLSASSNHIVKITSGEGVKLSKNVSKRRHALTLQDIESKHGSVESFLSGLPSKGFKQNVVFVLQKMYGSKDKTTYHLVKEIREDLEQKTMNTTNTNNQSENLPIHNFLASPGYINKMVEAERSNDFKNQVEELKEENKELRSDIRILREKNSALSIQLETAKERKELAIQQTKLDSKGVLESPTVQALAGALPDILKAVAPNLGNAGAGVNAGALGSPISPTQRALLEKIKQEEVSDQKIAFMIYLLDHWKEGIEESLIKIIENK
ncbi:hypothetical protein [uncultured Tenacibaculum sp.]|uniref:hypothetical protein n=1 Tax=uncultured Tenacibaculum sp. TaxID=174713 RepID=UPI002628097C|nr:hypothetical protein [uncultured Tenacibaculum sp.]